MVQVVRDMNAMLDSPTGRGVLPSGTGATPTLEQRLADLRRDRQLSRHLGLGGGGSWLGRAGALFGEEAAGEEETTPAPAPGAGGNYSWGSALMPWEVAANGQRFVREHVRMADALVYIRLGGVGSVGY